MNPLTLFFLLCWPWLMLLPVPPKRRSTSYSHAGHERREVHDLR